MVQSLSHRGPDETGYWISPEAALGIARLSIIDVTGGHQPVFSADGAVVAVLNGEIYNFVELRQELQRDGVVLRSGSDAEVIPHLYQIHGPGFLRLLRGMFAIALWDAREERLLLARDRVGKKPLVYVGSNQCLMFASEARALLVRGRRPEVDLSAIDHVLAFDHLPLDRSAFRGIRSLPPGHVLLWKKGISTLERYWTWRPDLSPLPMAELGETVEAALVDAVKIRLISERPIGSFLSGGIDSTIVTALMARHHAGPVKTFSIGFSDAAYDESRYAKEVAAFLGTDHTEYIIEPDPVAIIDLLANAYDQPFADSSAIPTLLLCEMASRDVVVALSGDGGDEAFGGYVRYWAAPAMQRLRPLLFSGRPLRRPLMAASHALDQPRLARMARALTPVPDLGHRYLQLMTWIPPDLRSRLWTPEASAELTPPTPESIFLSLWDKSNGLSALDRMREHDVSMYLPGDLLTKVDIASMAFSLEVRSPFLDQELLMLAGRMPRKSLVRGMTTKWILRQLAYRLVPRNLVDRPKRGFAIPRAAWLRGPLRAASFDLLLGSTAQQRGWFNTEVVEALLRDHESGVDRDAILWPLLMTEVWARRWVDRTTA